MILHLLLYFNTHESNQKTKNTSNKSTRAPSERKDVNMMHTIWKGSISFGLVHIPIKMYAATENKSISMRQLHNKCHTPIKCEKTCPNCEVEVAMDDIVKGYEYEKGQFVLIEQEEMDALKKDKHKNIDIVDFIELSQVDPIYFNKSYYLGPSENGEKAYSLLRDVMHDESRIALAKFILRDKEHLAAIRVFESSLLLETLYFPDEIRKASHVPGVQEDVQTNEKELTMAKQLVEQLTTTFEPGKFEDEYRNNLQAMIQAKIQGNEVKIAPEVPQTDISNLMDALQESLKTTAKPKPKARKKRKSS